MGKSLQDRIKELDEYRPDIIYKDGYFVLKITFKKGWNVIPPDDERVVYSNDDCNAGVHWYVSSIENAELIFDLVEDSIMVNKEMEKKLILYKEKVKELQELFLSDVPYDKLETLQFTYPDANKKAKSKNKNKKTERNNDNNDVVDTQEISVSEVTSVVPTDVKINDIDSKVEEALKC